MFVVVYWCRCCRILRMRWCCCRRRERLYVTSTPSVTLTLRAETRGWVVDYSMKRPRFISYLPHAVNCGWFCFWRHQSVVFLFVNEIPVELLNGCVSNSQGRRVWSLACMSLNVRGQRSRALGKRMGFSVDISGIAELICTRFIRETCLVPRSDKFEGQR